MMCNVIVSLPDGTMTNAYEAYVVWKRRADKTENINADLLEALIALVAETSYIVADTKDMPQILNNATEAIRKAQP